MSCPNLKDPAYVINTFHEEDLPIVASRLNGSLRYKRFPHFDSIVAGNAKNTIKSSLFLTSLDLSDRRKQLVFPDIILDTHMPWLKRLAINSKHTELKAQALQKY